MKANDNDKFRIERDSLGEIHVPANALYGAQTQRALENFPISDIRFSRNFIHALGLIKYACAAANEELGLLDSASADAIKQSALAISKGDYDSHFPVDIFQTGSGTSTNMNANEVIATLAARLVGKAVHPNDLVNMSQSSNDVIPSCIHLSAAIAIQQQLIPSLNYLHKTIHEKMQSLSEIVKTGRTHLMDAMPVTFAQELSGWAMQIKNNISRIENSGTRLHQLAIGGTAVGTGINTHPQFALKVVQQLSQLTGLNLTVKENYFEALSCHDTAVEVSANLRTLSISLMKICNDLRWMNSGPLAGIGEITLPALQPGSSIMPGKVNPVIPEAVAMVCAQVMGNDTTITIAGQSGNFQLNVMQPVIAHNLLESIELLTNSANLLAKNAISGFTVNQQKINQTLEMNPVLVTALNKKIGYDLGAKIAKQAYQQKRSIFDVAIELTDLDEAELKNLLDPKNMT